MLSKLYDCDISPMFPLSPLFDTSLNDEDIHFFHQHHHPHPHLLQPNDPSVLNKDTSCETIAESEIYNTMEACNNNVTTMNKKSSSISRKSPRKRTDTKDRHTKIATAQGLRDRRMRLSFDIARRFFRVQDMLGFDKASKTVEWLLIKSEAAINELSSSVSQPKLSFTGSVKSPSSTSECEVVSRIDEMVTDEYLQLVNMSSGKSSTGVGKERKARQARKPTFNPLSKESRAKARERARERTKGKKCNKSCQQPPEVRLHNPQELRSSSSFGEDSITADMELISQLDCQGTIGDESFGMITKSCSSSMFDYPQDIISQCLAPNHNNFPTLSANWNMDPTGATSSYCSMMSTNLDEQIAPADTNLHSEFADIQFYRPWDPYNAQGLCLQH